MLDASMLDASMGLDGLASGLGPGTTSLRWGLPACRSQPVGVRPLAQACPGAHPGSAQLAAPRWRLPGPSRLASQRNCPGWRFAYLPPAGFWQAPIRSRDPPSRAPALFPPGRQKLYLRGSLVVRNLLSPRLPSVTLGHVPAQALSRALAVAHAPPDNIAPSPADRA